MEINCESYCDTQIHLKSFLECKEPFIILRYIHWQTINEVLDKLGFIELHIETNGWQHDRWSRIWKPGSDYYYEIKCSWYYPETTFTLKNDIETIKLFKNIVNDNQRKNSYCS